MCVRAQNLKNNNPISNINTGKDKSSIDAEKIDTIYFLFIAHMHRMKRATRTANLKTHDSITKYPYKTQRMSRWEQCADNFQNLHASIFLWKEAEGIS